MAKANETTQEIHVAELKRGEIRLRIIGITPMFQHRMAAKAMRTLLLGGGKKTAAEKKQIKHDPLEEYRTAAEIAPDGPTALGLRVVAIKAAMCTAALETPGMTKSGAQRLLWMPGDLAPLYGTPQLRMDVVRSADMNKTPDIRTRPFLPKWGAEVVIHYVIPQLSASAVVALLCNAGILIGVGDFRQEKGKGAFGSFRVIGEGEHDAEWDDLVKHHGRKAQEAALESPEYANAETAELMAYYEAECLKRIESVTPKKSVKRQAEEAA